MPQAVIDRLLGARRVLAIGHESPDADAFGFALGVGLAVEQLGGSATIVSSDPVPAMYGFMPGIERVRTDPDPEIAYDLIVVGDSGDLPRVGRVVREHAELFGRVPIMVIDHHASNTGFGAVDWIDTTAAAACEMVALLVPRLGIAMDAADGRHRGRPDGGRRGRYRDVPAPQRHPAHAAGRQRAARRGRATRGHRAAAVPHQAQRAAAALRHRARHAWRPRSTAGWCGPRSSPADIVASGAAQEHSEGIIDLLAQSSSADVAILFRDMGERTRISTRTRDGGVDAIELTRMFGGGGHARAAGATVELPLGPARDAVLAAAAGLIDRSAGRLMAAASHRAVVPTGSSSSTSPSARPRMTWSPSCAACRESGGSAMAGRSIRSRPGCCRCSWGEPRAWSSTTSATRRPTGR